MEVPVRDAKKGEPEPGREDFPRLLTLGVSPPLFSAFLASDPLEPGRGTTGGLSPHRPREGEQARDWVILPDTLALN